MKIIPSLPYLCCVRIWNAYYSIKWSPNPTIYRFWLSEHRLVSLWHVEKLR